jgi:hypothetical protein
MLGTRRVDVMAGTSHGGLRSFHVVSATVKGGCDADTHDPSE